MSLLHQDYDINALGYIKDHVMYHYISYGYGETPRNPWEDCPIETLLNKDELIEYLRATLGISNLAFFYHRHRNRKNVHIGLAKFSSCTGKWIWQSVLSSHPKEDSMGLWESVFDYWVDQDIRELHSSIGNVFYKEVSLGPNDWNSIWARPIDPVKI